MYSQHYALIDRLQQDSRLIASPDLYPFDDQKIYAAMLDILAQPLPNGEESPFSSKAPTSGHAILMGAVAYYQSVLAHEFNLIPDRAWVLILQLLGAELSLGSYPVVNVVFTGEPGAVVPIGVEVRSQYNPQLSIYTVAQGTIDTSGSVKIPARLNQIGKLPAVRLREFMLLPRSLSRVQSAYNDGTVIAEGRAPETIAEAVLRVREGIRTGSLGREPDNTNSEEFQGRCVSDRDYYYWAKRCGATKANVLKGVQYGAEGVFGDLVTVVVYPPAARDLVMARMLPMTLHRFDVRPAEIIPLDGKIQVRVQPNLSDSQVFNLVAAAIQAQINPPNGIWGDSNFEQTLAVALEKVNGIYAVPSMILKHVETGQGLAELEVKPWNLFEIRGSLQVEVLR
jgi:hypothetical protein